MGVTVRTRRKAIGNVSVLITKAELSRLRTVEGMTRAQIATYYGVSVPTVKKWLWKFGISLDDGQLKRLRREQWKTTKGQFGLRADCQDRKLIRGYVSVVVPDHPARSYEGRVCEHRLVIEAAIGRYLYADEVVHHLNFIRSDNRLENLLLLPSDNAHGMFHRWLEHIGAFEVGFGNEKPVAFTCGSAMFYRGQWVNEIPCPVGAALSNSA